jgi:hypothetical protein
MKAFLSSTVEGLRDARFSYIDRLERLSNGRVTLVCYENGSQRHPGLTPEETCLALVRECQALIVLLDQYYGTPSKTFPGISITHAEVREALRLGLTVIPVVRTQTWHEYSVWRRNPANSIVFAHVKEPAIFIILNELYSTCNCHIYDHLIGDEAMTNIISALNAVITLGSTGAIQHVALAADSSVTSSDENPQFSPGPPSFAEGQVLHADEMNALYRAIVAVAAKHGLAINPAVTWGPRDMLTASQLNILLEEIATIYRHIGKDPPQWSFGCFRVGQVVTSSHLNEVSQRLRAI